MSSSAGQSKDAPSFAYVSSGHIESKLAPVSASGLSGAQASSVVSSGPVESKPIPAASACPSLPLASVVERPKTLLQLTIIHLQAFIEDRCSFPKEVNSDLQLACKFLKAEKDFSDVERVVTLIAVVCRDLYFDDSDAIKECIDEHNFDDLLTNTSRFSRLDSAELNREADAKKSDQSELLISMVDNALLSLYHAQYQGPVEDGGDIYHILQDIKTYKEMKIRLYTRPLTVIEFVEHSGWLERVSLNSKFGVRLRMEVSSQLESIRVNINAAIRELDVDIPEGKVLGTLSTYDDSLLPLLQEPQWE